MMVRLAVEAVRLSVVCTGVMICDIRQMRPPAYGSFVAITSRPQVGLAAIVWRTVSSIAPGAPARAALATSDPSAVKTRN
jgi:hypothetical protein